MGDLSKDQRREQALQALAERREQRRRLKARYQGLYEEALSILARYDPVGLGILDMYPDEYAAEVDTILPRLSDAHAADDVQRIVYEEFCWWFSSARANRAGLKPQRTFPGAGEAFRGIGQDLWEAWRHWHAEATS